jgi:cell division protein FtsZ
LEAGAIDGARGILLNITGSSTLKLAEVNEASTIIQSAAHEDANIIFGAVLDEKMKDEVKVTVIATGFRTDTIPRRVRPSAASALAHASRPASPPEAPSIQPRAEAAAPPQAVAGPLPPEPESPANAVPPQRTENRDSPGPPLAAEVAQPPSPEPQAPAIEAVEAPPAPAVEAPPLEEPPTRTWQAPTPGRESESPESVAHGTKGEYEQDDLDVPAFLRRGDRR